MTTYLEGYKIPIAEVKFHPHSFNCNEIRLFQWNEQLYRGINHTLAPHYKKLFENGIIQRLVEKHFLVDSNITPFEIDGYQIVVHHQKLPFASYPNEWCAAMLKDAALTLIDLAIELAKDGLTLADAHPWNLLIDIDTCKPVFVDLGSIQTISGSTWSVYDEFCRFCLYPLILMSQDQDLIARLLLCEEQGVLKSDLLNLIEKKKVLLLSKDKLFVVKKLVKFCRQFVPQFLRSRVKYMLDKAEFNFRQPDIEEESRSTIERIKQNAHLSFLKQVKRELESITLPIKEAEQLTDCNEKELYFMQNNWTIKQKKLFHILEQVKPKSVLDIGSGDGWYSKLAAHMESRVVAFDLDKKSVTQLYLDALKCHLAILPLVMDFTKPTPSRGLSNHWAIAAADRFKCDLVLALGLVHEIVFKHRLNFSQIAEGLNTFSNQWAVVEYISPEDQDIVNSGFNCASWYTLENFIGALKKYFCRISSQPSDSDSRMLFLCEK